ncbi:MAG: aldose epimerase [Terracidiphilus sp.]
MTESLASDVKIENVLIRVGECAVTVLPRFGGKIASIRIGERELLQTPLAPIAPRTLTMAFDAGDASGWDECLPSVAACTVKTEAGIAEIPDHGDLWRVEWMPMVREAYSGTYRGECFSLPLRLERTLTLTERAAGWTLRLDYSITNLNLEESVPWSWAAHPLFAVEEGDRIVLPESIRSLRLEGSGGGRLGNGGDSVAWPMARLANGRTVDLTIVEAADSGIGDKLFAGPLSESENWCTLERPSAGIRIRVKFEATATPYLGLWICYGGWPDRPGPKQVCVALEPATAPVDSLAVTGEWSRVLEPGDCFSWPMDVEIERIER